MLPILEKLLVLQDRDVRLNHVRQELQRIPLEEKQVADKLAVQCKEFEALKLRAKQVEAERKDLDNQVLATKERVARYKTQQFQTKKNEEFQALSIEIERAEKEIIELEDRELELMEAYEKAQQHVATEQVRVNEFEQGANARRKELENKAANLRQEQVDLEAAVVESEEEIKALDAASLSLYRRILKSKGDVAIVPIEHENTCGGCHMKLTHQTILQAKGEQKLAVCENCGRIVYWKSEFA